MAATTYQWVGGTSIDWTDPANWNLGAVPNAIDATAVVDVGPDDATIFNGASVTVDSLSVGGTGTVAGQVVVGGSPEIGSGGRGTLVALQTIDVSSTDILGAIVGGPGGLIKAPALNLHSGGVIGGGGTFDVASFVNNGWIEIDGSRTDLNLGPVVLKGGTVTGTGYFSLENTSTFELGSATSLPVFVASGTTETPNLILDNPATFTGAINFYNPGEHLHLFLAGQTPTGVVLDTAHSLMVITGASGTLEAIPFSNPDAVTFSVVPSTLAGYGEISINAGAIAAPALALAPVGAGTALQESAGSGPVQTGTAAGDTLDLSASTQAATINLAGNDASVAAGLNQPSLSFIGTPDQVILGSAATTIQYALDPSSGIETIAKFQFGTDTLDIDLMGSTLQAFDTSVGGVPAISLASSDDLTHGVVLLNPSATQTASDLQANHFTPSGDHMLIS